jgi:hypothetical protein
MATDMKVREMKGKYVKDKYRFRNCSLDKPT